MASGMEDNQLIGNRFQSRQIVNTARKLKLDLVGKTVSQLQREVWRKQGFGAEWRTQKWLDEIPYPEVAARHASV